MHLRLDRADVDDAALDHAQRFEEGVGDVEHAVKVDREDVVPVLGDRHRVAGDRVAPVDAGVVDQDRDIATFRNLGSCRPAGRAVGDIELHRRRLAACLGDETHRLLRAVRIGIEHDHASGPVVAAVVSEDAREA